MSEVWFDEILEVLQTVEQEMDVDEIVEARAEARLLCSGVNRFYGQPDKQVRYMMAALVAMNVTSMEQAVLVSVEFAEGPDYAIHKL